MAWIESHQELRDHPKRKRLSRLLGISRRETIGLLHEFWWWAYDYAPEGVLSGFTDEDIADAVDWERDPGELVAALIESGFINEDRKIHDWEDFAQKWIERRRADRERKRAASRKANAPTDVVHTTSNGTAPEIHSQSGVTGPDRTGPDRTGPNVTSPQPPPREGEAPPAPRRRGERHRRGGRENGAADHDEAPEPVALTPATPEDVATWNQALGKATDGMLPANAERIIVLEPIGRAPDGGLHLRAPPGWSDSARFIGTVRAALFQSGDDAGKRAVIVQDLPGSTEG